jgi:hypothetical protein
VSLTHAVVFDCFFNESRNWGVIRDDYVYYCRAIITDSVVGILEGVSGDHLPGKTNADVEILFIRNQILNRIPIHIDRFFPNIKGIRINHSSLLTLSANELRTLPNLVFLASWANRVTSIDGDLLKYTPKIKHFEMLDSLEHVGHGLFDNLPDLVRVDMRGNPCVDIFADNPQSINNLKVLLPGACPPKEAEQCSADCLEIIGALERRVRSLERMIGDILIPH